MNCEIFSFSKVSTMDLQTPQIQQQSLEDLGNLTELQTPQLVTSTPLHQQHETFTLTLPPPPVPILTPVSRSYEYLTTPTGKNPVALRQYSQPSNFEWDHSQWLNTDGIPHEIPSALYNEFLPPSEHSPEIFPPPVEAPPTDQLEESRKRAACSTNVDIPEVSIYILIENLKLNLEIFTD